jgi:hypothetical protein
MSVLLEIPDGNPWYLSPDVWTVPGSPDGAQGLPIVGQPCYLWARVTNNGKDGVNDATVRFYWANPSVGFDRNTANHIGDANVSLNAGETQDVLCLVPWMPSFVNGGHECILAEAFHPSQDPLPASPDFNVPTDRHVAQRNLSVVMMSMHMKKFSMPFEIHNTGRVARTFSIKTRHGNEEQLRSLHKHIGGHLPKLTGELKNSGFIKSVSSCDNDEPVQHVVERLEVPPGAKVGLTIVGELESGAALLHVIQEVDGKEIGGLSVLVVHSKK